MQFITSKMKPATGDADAALVAIRRRARVHQEEIRNMSDDKLAEIVIRLFGHLGLIGDGAPEA